jgi:hypothetical protein
MPKEPIKKGDYVYFKPDGNDENTVWYVETIIHPKGDHPDQDFLQLKHGNTTGYVPRSTITERAKQMDMAVELFS